MPSPIDSRDSLGSFDSSLRSLAPRYRAAAITGFGLAYAALDIVGNELRVQDGTLVIIWPAAGLLLVALFLAPPRTWIWLLSLQLSIGVLVTRMSARQDSMTSASVPRDEALVVPILSYADVGRESDRQPTAA